MPLTHSTVTDLFTDIADAIRVKGGTTSSIIADQFPDAIAALPAGSGGVTINNQNKTVTPTKSIQVITKDNNTYTGLGTVTVNAIPSNYIDPQDTTATASDVRYGADFYNSNAEKTTGTLKFDWIGENPELVQQIYSLNTTLDQTNFSSWTATTAATTMKASVTLSSPKPQLDLNNYDYVLV